MLPSVFRWLCRITSIRAQSPHTDGTLESPYGCWPCTVVARIGVVPPCLELSMDIRKWLDETVLPQQPPSPSPHDQRHEYPALRIERARRAPIEKHKRKQSTSDSSLLDDPRQRRSSVVPKQGNIIKENVNEGASASHPTSRSESSVSSEPYRRKPRRKTRPERYEPVPQGARERGTHTRRQKKGESKKTSRISRRNKSGKPRNDIVESFQAKNVPRDRLTVTCALAGQVRWWCANIWSS